MPPTMSGVSRSRKDDSPELAERLDLERPLGRDPLGPRHELLLERRRRAGAHLDEDGPARPVVRIAHALEVEPVVAGSRQLAAAAEVVHHADHPHLGPGLVPPGSARSSRLPSGSSPRKAVAGELAVDHHRLPGELLVAVLEPAAGDQPQAQHVLELRRHLVELHRHVAAC